MERLGVTEFQTSPVGRIYTSNSRVYCEGERRKKGHGNEVVDLLLVLETYRLETTMVQLRVRDQSVVHDITNQRQLPGEQCHYQAGACSTSDLTYVWQVDMQTCRLQIVREVQVERGAGLWVAHAEHLAFNESGVLGGDLACRVTSLVQTTGRGIYLTFTTTGHALKHIEGVNIEIEGGLEANLLYRQYREWLTRPRNKVNAVVCERVLQAGDHELVQTPVEGVFVMRSGRALYEARCPRSTGRVAPQARCYAEIPVMGAAGVLLFVHPVTQVARAHSRVVPCTKDFPAWFQAEGQWFVLNPQLTRTEPPPPFPQHQDRPALEDEGGNLFTVEEQKQWETVILFPMFSDSTTVEKSVDSCISQDCLHQGTADGFPLLHQVEEQVEGIIHLFNPLYWAQHHSSQLLLYSFFYAVVAALVTIIGAARAVIGLGWKAGLRVLAFGAMPAFLAVRFEAYLRGQRVGLREARAQMALVQLG